MRYYEGGIYYEKDNKTYGIIFSVFYAISK